MEIGVSSANQPRIELRGNLVLAAFSRLARLVKDPLPLGGRVLGLCHR